MKSALELQNDFAALWKEKQARVGEPGTDIVNAAQVDAVLSLMVEFFTTRHAELCERIQELEALLSDKRKAAMGAPWKCLGCDHDIGRLQFNLSVQCARCHWIDTQPGK